MIFSVWSTLPVNCLFFSWMLLNVFFSVSSDASYAPISEVTESELPPADCEEEETNPYDNDRYWYS